MNRYARSSILIVLVGTVFFLVACTPNRTMTRTDGVAGHDVKGASAQEDQRYASSDDFDVESSDVERDAAPSKAKPRSGKPVVKSAPVRGGEETGVAAASGSGKYYQTGVASWYGREFQGKKTASGEKFDMYDLTAAHRTLPLGTVVLVKNLDNGKTVKVRINDRGPFKGKRILDLSYAAGKKIDMLGEGEARVGITVVGAGSRDYSSNDDEISDDEAAGVDDAVDQPAVRPRVKAGAAPAEGDVAIQAGAFYSKRNADKLKDKISEMLPDHDVSVVHDGDMYKVRVTGIRNSRDAERFKRELKRENVEAMIVNQE
jgi:rare lipoprotein A